MGVSGHEDNIIIFISSSGVQIRRGSNPKRLRPHARAEAESGAPPGQGRSVVSNATGYSVMSMVINEDAAPGHSISLGVGVYPVTAGLTTNGSSAL